MDATLGGNLTNDYDAGLIFCQRLVDGLRSHLFTVLRGLQWSWHNPLSILGLFPARVGGRGLAG